jgi:hypothetical protein
MSWIISRNAGGRATGASSLTAGPESAGAGVGGPVTLSGAGVSCAQTLEAPAAPQTMSNAARSVARTIVDDDIDFLPLGA